MTTVSEGDRELPAVTKPEVDAAYDLIDRYLRNNLDDSDYARYSDALELVYAYGSLAASIGKDKPHG